MRTIVTRIFVAPGYLASIALLFVLAACSPDVPHAPTLERTGLMKLVFPDWQAKGLKANQPLTIGPDASQSVAVEEDRQVLPLHVIKLDETHAVLVTQSQGLDAEGTPQMCHACPLGVGAYFFEKDAKGWALHERIDELGHAGLEGNLGDTRVERMGDAYVMFVEWGSCWQGYCGSWLEAFAFRPGKGQQLGKGIRMSAENTGAGARCEVTPKANPTKEAATAATEADEGTAGPACMDVTGHWQVREGKLQVSFKGLLEEPAEHGGPARMRRVKDHAIYVLEGDQLKLVAGNNPTPSF